MSRLYRSIHVDEVGMRNAGAGTTLNIPERAAAGIEA
jgi:hypothetical protein